MKSIYHKLIALSSICGIICLFMIPTVSHAQSKCSNQRLTDIYEQLDQTKQTEHLPIVINKNPQGIIDHIGIKLFDKGLILTQVTPIYRFIERYFLELLLLSSQQEIMNKMKIERIKIDSDIHSMVSIKEGLQNIIDDFSLDQSVHIICHNNRYIVSFMKSNKNLLKMSFPVRYE